MTDSGVSTNSSRRMFLILKQCKVLLVGLQTPVIDRDGYALRIIFTTYSAKKCIIVCLLIYEDSKMISQSLSLL
jgi:hypothetical protein